MSFENFLWYIVGPGVGAVVGFVLSFVIEMWPKYDTFAPRIKRLVFIGLSFAIPLLAATLLGLLGAAEWTFDPLYWSAIMAGFTCAFGGELAHTRFLPST